MLFESLILQFRIQVLRLSKCCRHSQSAGESGRGFRASWPVLIIEATAAALSNLFQFITVRSCS